MRERNANLDLIRVIACLGVIVNHTNSSVFLESAPGFTWFTSLTLFFCSKIAVPMFLMVTGYLLLDRQWTAKQTFARFGRYLLVLVLFSVPCYLLYHRGEPLSVRMFAFYTLWTPMAPAYWYLYLYLGILLMLPLLQKLVSVMRERDYWYFFGISLFFFSLLPIIGHLIPGITLNSWFDVSFFGPWTCMMLLGSYFKRYGQERLARIPWYGLLAAGITALAFNVLMTWREYRLDPEDYLFFDDRVFLPVMIESIAVFALAMRMRLSRRVSAVVSFAGQHTFGIFLVTDLLIYYLNSVYLWLGRHTPLHVLFRMTAYQLSVFAAGLIIAVILKKIPGLKKLI